MSDLGDGILTIALAFAVLDLTHSATDLGIVLACKLASQVVMLLLGGVIADRISRLRVMMASDLIRMVGQAVTGVLLITHHATLAELIVSQVILGGAAAFFQPASMGMIPQLAGDFRQEANAMRGIAEAASSIAGPALGAVLVAGIGADWGLLADAVSYGLSVLALSQVHHALGSLPAEAESTPRRSLFRDLADGWGVVRRRTWLWATIAGFGVTNALFQTWNVFGPLSMRRWYHGPSSFALLSICFAVGTLLGGIVTLRLKPQHPLLVGVLCCIPAALPSVFVALRLPLIAVMPFQALTGAGQMACNTLWWTALQDNVPAAAMSRVISFDFAGSYLMMPVGTAVAGPLAAALGLKHAMLLCAGLGFVTLCSTLALPAVRNLRAALPKADIVSA